jgi:hypothetical protein
MFWVLPKFGGNKKYPDICIINNNKKQRAMWEVTLWVIKNPIESEETTVIEYLIDANDEFEAMDKAKKQCPYSVYDSTASEF